LTAPPESGATSAARRPKLDRAVIVGDLEVTRLTCGLLTERGVTVLHLPAPTERELAEALATGASAIAILVRGDVVALRYALLAEHLRPGIRLVATLFDQTLADQLRRVVPNSHISSPADVAAPAIVGACLEPGVLAALRDGDSDFLLHGPLESPSVARWSAPRRSWSGALSGQLRAHDDSARILLAGLAGLVLVLLTDWVLSMTALHDGPLPSFYNAVRVIATVGPADAGGEPRSYLVVASTLMLITIVLTAIFTAGVVNRVLSGRSVAVLGRRTVPRRQHVVVIGLGQVGLRVAIRLRSLRIPVVVIERDPQAPNLRLAKRAGIPVLVAHAEDRAVLARLRLDRARALVALGSHDLDNVETAIAALAVAPRLRVVLRAGESDLIAETCSLFPIGEVRDVTALTAVAITLRLLGSHPLAIVAERDTLAAFDGVRAQPVALGPRCRCRPTA